VSVSGTVCRPLPARFSRPGPPPLSTPVPRRRPPPLPKRHALFHPRADLSPRRPGRFPMPGRARTLSRVPLRVRGLPLPLRPAYPEADDPAFGTLQLSAGEILTPLCATHTGIRTPVPSTAAPAAPSLATGRSPTQLPLPPVRCVTSAPSIPGAAPPGPVSYYALFQGWLLLSQPPGCLRCATTFLTLSHASGPYRTVWALALSTPELLPRRLTPLCPPPTSWFANRQ